MAASLAGRPYLNQWLGFNDVSAVERVRAAFDNATGIVTVTVRIRKIRYDCQTVATPMSVAIAGDPIAVQRISPVVNIPQRDKVQSYSFRAQLVGMWRAQDGQITGFTRYECPEGVQQTRWPEGVLRVVKRR